MQTNEVYSWQQEQWQYLVQRKNNNNLPHALLMSGIDGLGKFNFAKLFARFVLCKNNNVNNLEYPCQSCSSCQLMEAMTHPDLLLIQKEDKEKTIKVDQIRELITELYHTSQQGGAKVAIINIADSMNGAASNALLKTLEEPAAGVYIILITSKPSFLPATIRSRCQNIIFKAPDVRVVKNWLANNHSSIFKDDSSLKVLLSLTNNSPFKILEFLQEDKIKFRDELFANFCNVVLKQMHFTKFAELYLQEDLSFVLLNFVTFVMDLVKVKQKVAYGFLINEDKQLQIEELGKLFSLQGLFQYLDKILEINKFISEGLNLNKQMLLERLVFDIFSN